MPYCTDCKHVRIPDDSREEKERVSFAKCGALSTVAATRDDLVSPQLNRAVEYAYCSIARNNASQCGPDAKLFEPKAHVSFVENWAKQMGKEDASGR